MISLLVAVLMWLLVVSLLILRRGRGERSITHSAVAIAVAMTLNIDATYVAVDRVFGGTNIATLLSDLTLMVGIFFLGRAIAHASRDRLAIVRIALGPGILGLALAGVTIAFSFIDRRSTTTTFMLDVGAQPAAATYSIIQFAYDGIVVATMALIAAQQVASTHGLQRVPPVLLLIGSMCGMALTLTVIVMDAAHVVGAVAFMSTLGPAYDMLYLATFVFLCLGLAGQPAVRWASANSRAARSRELVRRLAPVWERATMARPGISHKDADAVAGEDPDIQLHRAIVEIRDAVIDPRVDFRLNGSERQVLEDAEAHLLGPALELEDTRRGFFGKTGSAD